MAGHSQFKNIMHRKGAQDRKKAKVFNKIGREITLSVRQSGTDPDSNSKLRSALIAARAANMPNERIQKAIKAGSGEGVGDQVEDIRYEGYGPGGVALIIEAMTDNRNRTAPEIRTVMSKYGGALGETNSVAFQFKRVGQIYYPVTVGTADAVFEAALDAGADNVESDAEGHDITTAIEDYVRVLEKMVERFGAPQESGFVWIPSNTVAVAGDHAAQLIKMLTALDDLDDVQQVFGNYDIDAALMEKLSA
jgi:YebC/PmpR family DNA-binding regulatory protein